MHAISVKLPDPVYRKLSELTKTLGKNQSAVVREAIEALAGRPTQTSALDVAHDLVGCLDSSTKDLATNPKHMEGFGLSGAQRRALYAKKARTK